mmetsp:Transcript_9670/g.15540  ORF Transcript_9670/g.15540 Transcript_9670/m.15540 type:complete len:87 (+) Transcript_9670:181-441(+)|eukprot:CAMPEP_0198702428 /NCGR_PEP_ID=MMETSP1468-20131203/388759_1 /TAXON_ID=1461545 /ORGANISM="Mantoniella sp, Strain CCMP1436" /LENGTH=86 /DNA_ID=CAMNT_0044460963 /DNA_START=183 /DNA_END=443 /DNA_ORIENTATION=-
MGNSISNPLLACCCPEDAETKAARDEEMRQAGVEAREQAAVAAEQRQKLFDQSAHGKAAHKSQVNMRKQNAVEDRRAEQRVLDWNA